jgi:hypothetical protein
VSATDQEFQRSGSDRERQRAAKCLCRKVYTPSCLPSLVSIPIRRCSRITPWRSVKCDTSIRRSHKAGIAVLQVSKCDRFAETRLGRNHVHQEVAQSSYRDCGG